MTGGPRHRRQIWWPWGTINYVALLLLGVVAFQSTRVEAAVNLEGVALYAFRHAIVEDPNGVFNNWDIMQPTPCNWTGVTCDSDSRVTRLVLNNAGLTGSLSSALQHLGRLKTISLTHNSLSGIIPPEFAEITTLFKLNLSSNALVGAIPGELGRIGGMRLFDLSNNALSGPLPGELFSNCQRLRYISLAHNNFAGAIPSSVGNCVKMEGIDLSYNNFQGSIPLELGRLPSLFIVSLEHNFLSGRIPGALGNCTALQYLNLGANSLSENLPTELSALVKLTTLSVHDNFLTGIIPPEVAFLPSVEVLNLSSNSFSGEIPAAGGKCAALKELDLAANNLSGLIPADLSQCSHLRALNLSSNNIVSPIPPSLSSLPNIETLDLSFNSLSGGIPPELLELSGLTILHLEGNRMSGPIPQEIGQLDKLQSLDLHSMELEGFIPDTLTKCTALSSLDISDNQLSGQIPEHLSTLSNLQVLNLSSNMLDGDIPTEFGNLSKLRTLDFSNNSLDGFIPISLGVISNLTFFNVSFNNLSGPIPRTGSLVFFNMSSFLGNLGLCGAPLNRLCEGISPSVPPTSPIQRDRKGTRLLSTSSIIAICAAAFIAFAVFVVTIMNVRALRKRRRNDVLVYESSPPSPEVSPIVGKLVLFSKDLPSRYEDWKTGTKALLDRDCMIGRGTLGTVYKATFEGGLSIAVKKLETLGRIKNQDDFEQEMGLLGDLKHPNLVPLQGYYWSSAMQLLLSDFVPNNSLYNHLHQNSGAMTTLNWNLRFRIALGTAKGLAYLHHDCKPPVFHFNLKVSNILLDDEFEPRVTDYGFVKLLPMLDTYISSRKFHTTLGYVAPELACQSLRLTEKCDVYSYGMVLLELVTGRQPVESFENNVIVLGEFVRSSLEQGNVSSCVDPRLDAVPDSEIMQALKLGLICTSQVPSKRPTMAEVVQVLESIKTSSNSSEAASP